MKKEKKRHEKRLEEEIWALVDENCESRKETGELQERVRNLEAEIAALRAAVASMKYPDAVNDPVRKTDPLSGKRVVIEW